MGIATAIIANKTFRIPSPPMGLFHGQSYRSGTGI